jgi:hypothetical protein
MSNFADRVPAQQPQARRQENDAKTKVLAGSEAGTDMRSKLQRMADTRFERRQAERAARTAPSAKLEVGSAYDPLEAEADQAAQEVVHGQGKGGDLGSNAGSGQAMTKPLAMRITRKVQREEAEEGMMKAQREEDEAQMKAMREEDDSAMMKAQREEEEAQMRAMREEDDSAMMKAQREEDEAQMRAMREEDDSAMMKAQREEDEAQMKAMREEGDSAMMKAQREEDEAQMRAMREEDDSAMMKAQREEDEAQMKAQREEDEAQMRAMREEEEAQMKGAPENHLNGFTAEAETAALLQQRKGKGEPLSGPLKAEMEQGFGTDLSEVRVHRDAPAAELNQDLKAKAFTVGGDVFFGKDQFDPATKGGKELIAHELAHTVQQGAVEPAKGPEGAAIAVPGAEQKPATESGAGAGLSTPAAQGGAGAATPPPAPEAPAAEAAEPEAKQGEGEEKDKKEGKEGEAEEEEKLPDSPKDPKDDPAFQAVLASNTAVAGQQAAHTDPEAEVTELQGAAVLPEEAQAEEADMEGHMGAMEAVAEQQERKPFTPATFKEKLKSSLEELEKELPNDADSAEEFKEEEPIGGIKEDIAGQVAEEKNAIAGPLEATAGEAEPPATGAETIAELPLEPEDPGAAPAPLNPAAAVPKPFADHEISLEKESASLDEKMAENNVTEEQLEKSNEPAFLDGLSQKREAQQKAAEAPGVYRGQEAGILGAAQAGAAEQGEAGLQGMFQAKNNALTGVLEGQGTAEIGSETEQDRIKAEFQKIYDRTKESVNTQLEAITTQVTELFDTEAEAAKTTFEDNVEEKLDDIYGVTVIDDWLFGEDTEAIEKVFVEEKATFVATMDRVLDRIATIIADGLNAALATIAKGRDESKVFFDSLDESQKKLAQDSFDAFNDQYTSLEDTVYEKEDELARDLAQSYKDNVAGLRESFDKIKDEVSAGWIGGALNALVGIIETIIKIGEMLANLLSAVVEAIGAILEDPIGFLSNLIDGVKLGFEQFFTNIKTHIISGLIEWLTGSLGGVGITLPENIFSLAGVFDLTMQILGLGWDYLRDKAVKILGEPVVQAMEMGAELFIKLKNGGIDALWEELKEQFQDIQQVVMDAIRDMVITKVIEAGIKWIMGLLSPAGAFIKAAMMIIDIVTFFVERAASIIDLVMAFIDGIRALANGDVSSVANAIEKALAKAIPILIGFLAALVGVTGLAGKVQNIVKKIRKRVDKAVTKVIKKIGKKFKGKGKKGKGGKDDGGKDDGKPDKDGLTPADKKKHAKIGKAIQKKMAKVASKGKDLTFEELHTAKKKEAASLEQHYQKELNPNIKLTITIGDLASDKKDGDVDVKVRIAPNTYETTFAIGDKEGVGTDRFEIGSKGDKPKITLIDSQLSGKVEVSTKKYDQAYLGQVISSPGERVYDLPDRYSQQAFPEESEAKERFGLVIGLNYYRDIAGKNEDEIKAAMKKFSNKANYPLGVIGMIWEPLWFEHVDGKKQKSTPQEIKNALNQLSGDERQKAEENIALEEGKIKKPGTQHVPYGILRKEVDKHNYTSTISGMIKANTTSGDVYVHLGDADSMNLHVPGTAAGDVATIFGNVNTPLFSAYDKIIQDIKNSAHGKKPAIVSGGYRFEVTPAVGEGDQLRVIANQIDQEYRQAAAAIDPTLLYFPEPNTLIKLQGDRLDVDFGIGRNEAETIMKSLIESRKLGDGDIVWSNEASLSTTSKRFFAKTPAPDPKDPSKKIMVEMNGEVFAYDGSSLSGKGITLAQFKAMFQADQMHATKSKVASRLKAHPEYCDPSKDSKVARQFEDFVSDKLYVPTFPHTAILGASLDRAASWLNFSNELSTFQEMSHADLKAKIVTFYTNKAFYKNDPPAKLEERADKLAAFLISGASGVSSYLFKLFIDNQLKTLP